MKARTLPCRAALVIGGGRGQPAGEALGTQAGVGVFLFRLFRQQKKHMTRIVETIDEAVRLAASVRALSDRLQRLIHAHGHALIEDKAFAQPVLVPELLLVSHDPAVQLEYVLKSFASE